MTKTAHFKNLSRKKLIFFRSSIDFAKRCNAFAKVLQCPCKICGWSLPSQVKRSGRLSKTRVYNGQQPKHAMLEVLNLENPLPLAIVLSIVFASLLRPIVCAIATLILTRKSNPETRLKVLEVLCSDRTIRVNSEKGAEKGSEVHSRNGSKLERLDP